MRGGWGGLQFIHMGKCFSLSNEDNMVIKVSHKAGKRNRSDDLDRFSSLLPVTPQLVNGWSSGFITGSFPAKGKTHSILVQNTLMINMDFKLLML